MHSRISCEAYIAGAYLALSDVEKAKALIAQKYKTNDPKVIDATYNDFKRLMPLDAAPSIAGANNVIAQLQAIGARGRQQERQRLCRPQHHRRPEEGRLF